MQKGFKETGIFPRLWSKSQTNLPQHHGKGSPTVVTPAIFVDSEPKVVQNLRCRPRQDNIVFEQSGRGNNWAFGYSDSKTLCDKSLEAIRKEMERRHRNTGFNMVHGLSGGTGSGLGSRLIAKLREQYPKLYIVTNSVGGSNFGDTCLQPYNTLLTLETLQDNADAICFHSNDDIGQLLEAAANSARQTSRSKKHEPFKFSVADTNVLIARSMVGLFAPVAIEGVGNVPTCHEPFDAGKFVTAVAPMPQTKYVYLRSALKPQNTILSSSSPSKALVEVIQRSFGKFQRNLKAVTNFSGFWIARGDLDFGDVRRTRQRGASAHSRDKSGTDSREGRHPVALELLRKIKFASWNTRPLIGALSVHSLQQVCCVGGCASLGWELMTSFSQTQGKLSGSIIDAAQSGDHHTRPSLTLAVQRCSFEVDQNFEVLHV